MLFLFINFLILWLIEIRLKFLLTLICNFPQICNFPLSFCNFPLKFYNFPLKFCNFQRSNLNDLNFERLKEFAFSVDKLFWATENPCRKI